MGILSGDRSTNSFQYTESITTSAPAHTLRQHLDLHLVASYPTRLSNHQTQQRRSASFTGGGIRDDAGLDDIEVYDLRRTARGDTRLVSSWAKLIPKRSYLLHERGFNINGRLPYEADRFRVAKGDQVMEDVATQPATQPFLDPRRQGTKSMLSVQDEGDVLCILLPSSRPALRAVDLVAEASPQHILQNHFIDDGRDVECCLNHELTTSTRQGSDNEDNPLDSDTQNNDEASTSRPARDIALRMSSKVHNPCLGFVFGRNAKHCDLLISSDDVIRLSNCHFRIFLNRHGVLMLEDTSRNGTYVDKVLLRSSEHSQGSHPSTRTLYAGAIIELPTITQQGEESIRFIVRFPARDQAQEQYNQNLAAYLEYIQQAERQVQVAAAGNGAIPPPVLMPFNAMKDKAEASPNASILAAATGDYNHGLNWNGGEKYNVVSYVGKGAFAMVYKLSAKKDGEVYACKQIEKRRFIKDGVLNHKVHNEILVMKDLEHPNIVKYIEYYETKVHIFIVMEFVSFGDLSVYTESGTVMHEYLCQIMAEQMFQALDYLHQGKITHRDIKPDNILVASHNPYVFKLSDFGLSKIVKNEETFLKSFCGTLLYCAPEVYPGFQRAKLGLHPSKRARSWEPRKGTQPYEHSVDVWSISAVLFHLLCGHPPYSGSMEDEGALMLMNIMKAPPNWEHLEQAGISGDGIDFIKRTLVIEPSLRAREAELLRHPWICPGAPSLEETRLQSGGNDAIDSKASELDASQLSLAEKILAQRPETEADELDDQRETKRSKHFQLSILEPEIDLFRSIGQDSACPGRSDHRWTENDPIDIPIRREFGSSRPRQSTRLFGEIGSSALRSSGALGQDLHAALHVPAEGSYDQSPNGSSEMDSEMISAESVSYVSGYPNSGHFNTGATPLQNHSHHLELLPEPILIDPAPSLLGTEALVDKLNMTSPESGLSGPSAESKPATPKTPASPDHSPAIGVEEALAQSVKPSASEVTPRPMINGQAEKTDIPPAQSPEEQQQEDPVSNAVSEVDPTLNTRGYLSGSHNTSDNSGAASCSDGRSVHNINKSEISLLPTAFNSQGSEHSAFDHTSPNSESPSPQLSSSHTITAMTATAGQGRSMRRPYAFQQSESFAKPPLRFGNLVPIQGSIPSVSIKLTTQATTFGRDPHSDFIHPDIREDRIPKNALDIALWYPNIERDIASGKTDWHLNESLTAIISTRTSRYIKVNGVRLMKGSGCWLYGKLRTGDVITIFGPPEGVDMSSMDGKQKEYLRFRCEFFIGGSKELRDPSKPFVVEKEEEKYKQNEMRKSRESSIVKSWEGGMAAVGVGVN
ncbi:MAG: hypothetical protein Q9163_005736 [Psora crenata]